jgi:hypothetical protein
MHEFNGTFELIDPTEIHFDRRYQRDQNWPLITTIAQNPIWPAFGVVICSKREYAGGLLYALDGQQRLTGVATAESPPKTVPVFWFPVKTVAEEAALFDVINTNRKAVAALQKFKARVTADNPVYTRIAAAVDRAGYTLGANAPDPNTLSAVGALETVYNAIGEEGVYMALAAYRQAWPDENAPTATMLTGLSDVMSEMNGNLSVDALATKLSKTTPGRLLRKAEALRYDQGGSKRSSLRKAFKLLAKV